MTSGMTHLEFPTKQDLTKRNLKIHNLVKKAIQGNSKAKEKLHVEYGIRLYSTSEIEKYERGKQVRRVKNLAPGKRTNGSRRQTVKIKLI
jgi:hypothetical protein